MGFMACRVRQNGSSQTGLRVNKCSGSQGQAVITNAQKSRTVQTVQGRMNYDSGKVREQQHGNKKGFGNKEYQKFQLIPAFEAHSAFGRRVKTLLNR